MKEEKSYNIPSRLSTKDYIAACFQQMLKTSSFDSISVIELADVCQISRTSFYRHFSDKYEVLAWIYKKQLDEIDMVGKNFSERMLSILILLRDNKKYFKNIFQNDKENWLADHIFKRGCANLEEELRQYLGINELSADDVSRIQFFNAGANHLWREWLFANCPEEPEIINSRIVDNMPDILKVASGVK